MSRKEAVLLVSRALAVIQFVTALLDITHLPEWLMSLHHHERLIEALGISNTDEYWRSYDQVGVAFLFARIAGLLVLTLVFWNCGPWFERVLLPKRSSQNDSNQLDSSKLN
jgi:hypothetical protein